MSNAIKTHAAEIKINITTKPAWAERAITALYAKQVEDEQRTEETKYHNGVGFNSTDAQLLTSFAKQIEGGRHLSEKQLVWAYKKLAKYATQLARIAAEKKEEQRIAA
jgi:hypothetical protein